MSDWRWENLQGETQLRGAALRRMKYSEYRPGWDHDHCIACWTKLAEFDDPAEHIEHEGYATTEDYIRGAEYDWVCVKCFADFKDKMGWTEV
jgi:hypothetical protein